MAITIRMHAKCDFKGCAEGHHFDTLVGSGERPEPPEWCTRVAEDGSLESYCKRHHPPEEGEGETEAEAESKATPKKKRGKADVPSDV